MCCFSGKVEKVADTSIFARGTKDGRQFLVYSMFVEAKDDVAMILPIPTPKNSKADAVKFINLERYPAFFTDMAAGFPRPRGKKNGKDKDKDKGEKKDKLPKVEVGSFVASFVPTVADFARVDDAFKLPRATWDDLPTYKDYGFALFQLRKGAKKIHPMAFDFPRADAKRVFFPTVHIHDGKVNRMARFDHSLYCQTLNEDISTWTESPGHPSSFMKTDACAGIVLADAHVYRKTLTGNLRNEDTWLT